MPGEIQALCEKADERSPAAASPHRTIICSWLSWKEAQAVASMIEKESTRPSFKGSTIDLLKAFAFCAEPSFIEKYRDMDPRFTAIALAGAHPSGEQVYSVLVEVVWNPKGGDIGFHGIHLESAGSAGRHSRSDLRTGIHAF